MKVLCIGFDPPEGASVFTDPIAQLIGHEVTVVSSLQEARETIEGSLDGRIFDAVLTDKDIPFEPWATTTAPGLLMGILQELMHGVVSSVAIFDAEKTLDFRVPDRLSSRVVITRDSVAVATRQGGFLLVANDCGSRELGRNWCKLLGHVIRTQKDLQVNQGPPRSS